MKFLVVALLLAGPLFTKAQDSTVIYYHGTGKEVKLKDSSAYYLVFTKQGKLWFGKHYYSKNDRLESQGTYLKKDDRYPVGSFDHYSDSGVLKRTTVYDKNSEVEKETTYYASGKKRSYISYGKKGATEQKGWTEEGAEIPGYIVERHAAFNGGVDAWWKYVRDNLNNEVPANHGLPVGKYTVTVSFQIDKEGNISNVVPEKFPPECLPCAVEAVRVVQNAPGWTPAIQYNKPVIYRLKQNISFVVEEEEKRSRGN
jgi:hypothetical protein